MIRTLTLHQQERSVCVYMKTVHIMMFLDWRKCVDLAPQNIPSATVLTLGSKAVLCVCTQLQCCGVNNYSDWFNIRAWPTEQRVPDSCCKQPEEGCGQLEPRFWFKQVSVHFPPLTQPQCLTLFAEDHCATLSALAFFSPSPQGSKPAMPLHYRKKM